MGEVVFIDVAKRERDLTVEEAFDRWRELDDKAKRTRLIEDGIAAGKAWGDFLYLFTRPQ